MIEKYVDAEELKRLISGLVIVLGCLIVAGLFASIVVPGLRNANRPATPTAVAPVAGEHGWLDPTEFPPQKGFEIPAVDPKTLMTPSPELIERGRALYPNNCAACHGVQGQGDGPAAATMNPRPRSFANPNAWVNGNHAPGIYKTLGEGIRGTSMAAFDYLPKKDRMALVHYVQSLGAFRHDTASAAQMADLSRALATAGEKTTNKIPVSAAIEKLRAEFSAAPALAVDEEDRSPGAELLRQAVTNPLRASQYLAQSRVWRAGYRELAASIAPGLPANGFSANTAAFSPAEWQLLHAELGKRVQTK
jgi:mono/diheme cytochrome c family protein